MPGYRRSRLEGIDATRGLAVLGMAAAHVLPEKTAAGETTLATTLTSGVSSAAFAVLAGVGVALATRDRPGGRARLALLVRALLIGALGLALGELDSGVAVILAFYAVFFVLLLPFLGWPPRRLMVASGVVAVVAPILSFDLRAGLPEQSFSQPVLESLASPGELAIRLLLTGSYPAVPWLAYLLAGLAVGKFALHHPRTAARVAATGAALAVAAALTSAALLGPLGGYERLAQAGWAAPGSPVEEVVGRSQYGNVPTDSAWWLATDARHSSTTPDLVGTIGTSLFALGAFLLLAHVARRALLPLAAVGSMPLTLYTAHVCVLGLTDSGSPTQYYLLQVGAALIFAPLWQRYVGRGPLEALLASATRRISGDRRVDPTIALTAPAPSAAEDPAGPRSPESREIG